MAFELGSTAQPEATLVTSYRVDREGVYPHVILAFSEVSRLLGYETSDITGIDENEDGIFEALLIPDWHAREELIGSPVYDETGSAVGNVSAVEGDVITLDTPLVEVPVSLGAQLRTITGSLAWGSVASGRSWELRLPTNSNAVAEFLGAKLGAALFSAVKAVMAVTPVAVSDAEILAAVQTLAAQGWNIDSFIAMQAEEIEKERRAGLAPTGVVVIGNAPPVT